MKSLSAEQLLRKFIKMPEAMQCGIIEQSFQRYHILKSRNDAGLNRSQLFHRALVFSLEAHHRVLHMGAAKKNSKELTTLEEKFKMQVNMILASKMKKKVTKSSKLKGHYAPLVYRLVEQEHFSFPQVSQFLAKHHSFKIGHTYICKLYPQMKQTIEDLLDAQRQGTSVL